MLASLAVGACDSLPARLLRSISNPNKTPVLIYPSMSADMFDNVWTARHIVTLQKDGCVVLGPQGRDGVKGRMIDWQDILIAVQDMATFFHMRQQQLLLRRTEEELRGSPDAGGSSSVGTREGSPAKRPRMETIPPAFNAFAPVWGESNAEMYGMGFFQPGQKHWQNKTPVTTGRSIGLGRREMDLTNPTWKHDPEPPEMKDGDGFLFPFTKNWWA